MACTKQPIQLHFLLIPLMAPGHIIPMIDMAKLLAQQGVTITIVTTPVNALRFGSTLKNSIDSGLPIKFLHLRFPSVEVGLPEGCENADALPSFSFAKNFNLALDMLQDSMEKCFLELDPRPSCIISDKFLAWSGETARKFGIPRIVFDGMSCFNQLCTHFLYESKVFDKISESEPFVVPGLPDRIEFTREQLPAAFNPGKVNLDDFRERAREAELGSYGVIINSFEELEQEYVNGCRKLKGDKVWCIGPLSLCNNDESEKAQRGSMVSIDVQECLKWLDSKEPGTVVYACLGSLTRLTRLQLIEFALGLELTNSPFVWVVRALDFTEEVEKWFEEEKFEERNKGRGLVIRGWAPQVLILSHPAIGAFLTHCGWNSTLEGVCSGLPMITWPQFGEQFFNEKLLVQILEIGVSVGAKVVVLWGQEEEKNEVRVKSGDLKIAIDKAMDEGKEGLERRKRAKVLGEMAKKATQGGGSSHLNVTRLIKDIWNQVIELELR